MSCAHENHSEPNQQLTNDASLHRLISRLSPVAGFSSATVPGLRALGEEHIPRFFPAGESGTVSFLVGHLGFCNALSTEPLFRTF